MLRPAIIVPIVLVGYSLSARLVNKEVERPYLDEIFHIPQAQKYCHGRFREWDASITTPPGIYIISSSISFLTRLSCSVPFLRFINLVLGSTVLPLLCSSIIRTSSPARLNARHGSRSLTIGWIVATFPLIFFFSLLYYTDIGSACSVLFSLALARRGKHRWAALAGWGSLWFRQTNIVWVGFIAIDSVLRAIEVDRQRVEGKDGEGAPVRPLLIRDKIGRLHYHPLVRSLTIPLTHVLTNPLPLLPILTPYVPVLISFLLFLKWNGGIVLGHQEMHSLSLHWAQMGYFLGFVSAMGWGVLFDVGLRRGVRGVWAVGLGNGRRRIVSVFILGLSLLGVHYGTVIHPFLLADNRHYFFYIWRRVFGVHPVVKYAACLGYLGCFWAWVWRLGRTHSLAWLIAFGLCTGAVLVPTPLVEPRYFLVPWLIIRLECAGEGKAKREIENGEESSDRWLLVELGWNTLINVVTLYVFLTVKFEWVGWEGWMRFMW